MRTRLPVLFVSVVLLAFPLSAGVVEVELKGIVHPISTEVISSAIHVAEQSHADALVIRLNTPGGFLEATRDIIQAVLHSKVPVIMWVGPGGARAASAGFFLLEAADIAAMAPGTNTGASHPVLQGGATPDPVMAQKMENDAAALLRTVTSHRGRDAAAAEKTVRESESYTDREALDRHLIDLIAPDPLSLLKQAEGREVTHFDGTRQVLHFSSYTIEPYRASWRQQILLAIADPDIALLLMVAGAMGIYVEFVAPGLVVPGVAGAICVLLGLSALSVFPIDWLGAALIILALVCFVLEAKFATHGILTGGGAVSLVLGSLMLVASADPALRIHLGTALAVAIPFAAITSFLLSLAVRARANKVTTGVEGMLGASAQVLSGLNPSGTVLLRGEYWTAVASSSVAAGESVRVTGVHGLTLQVEPALAQRKEEHK